MAQIQLIATISVFLITLLINKGYAIRCFECNSHEDKECDLPNPVNKLIDCGTLKDRGRNYTFCRKITQIIEFSVNNLPPDSRVVRTCGWDDSTYKNACYQRSGFGGRQEVCACETDGCNSANNHVVSSTVFGASVMMIFSLYMLRRTFY
jgi:hypothetical protein